MILIKEFSLGFPMEIVNKKTPKSSSDRFNKTSSAQKYSPKNSSKEISQVQATTEAFLPVSIKAG